MAIDKISNLPGFNSQRSGEGSQVQVSRSEPTRTQEETGRPSSVDTISLTDTAARLRELENTLSSLPVVDAQRLEAIQKAVENGSYEVDAKRVAEKMLAFEAALTASE